MYSMANLTPRQCQILRMVGKLGLATPDQLTRCFLAKTSRTLVYTECRLLAHQRLLSPVLMRDPDQPRGNAQITYKLGTRGYNELIKLGLVADGEIVYPSAIRMKRGGPTLHYLEAHEPVIRAHELIRLEQRQIEEGTRVNPLWKEKNLQPTLTMRFESESTLRRKPLKKDAFNKMPDAFVYFLQVNTKKEAAFLFEWDKASISLERIRERLFAYRAIDQSPEYFERFHTHHLRVVWICPTQKRADDLRHLAENINGLSDPQADLFAFGTLLDENPIPFYFAKYWQINGGQYVSLLSQTWKEQSWLRLL